MSLIFSRNHAMFHLSRDLNVYTRCILRTPSNLISEHTRLYSSDKSKLATGDVFQDHLFMELRIYTITVLVLTLTISPIASLGMYTVNTVLLSSSVASAYLLFH